MFCKNYTSKKRNQAGKINQNNQKINLFLTERQNKQLNQSHRTC